MNGRVASCDRQRRRWTSKGCAALTELGYGLLPDGDAAGTSRFITVVETVDGEAVVARAEAGEAEATIRGRAPDAGLGAQCVRTSSGGVAEATPRQLRIPHCESGGRRLKNRFHPRIVDAI